MGIFTIEPAPWPAKSPTWYLPTKWLSILTAFLPAIACYFCIASTLILQRDVISNYTLSNCPGVRSSLPPISYSIGVWEPQKLVWIFALMVHIPPRIMLTRMVPQIWLPGLGQYIQTTAAIVEMLGLICVTVFTVDSIIGFHAHAGFFVIWWAAAMWGMGIMIHLQRLTGLKDKDPFIRKTWWLKIGITATFFIVSAMACTFYPISQIYCSIPAFTIFCICEYSVVGLNAAFWGVALYEFGREFEGFLVTSVRRRRDDLSDRSETPIDKSIEAHGRHIHPDNLPIPGALVVKIAL